MNTKSFAHFIKIFQTKLSQIHDEIPFASSLVRLVTGKVRSGEERKDLPGILVFEK